MYRKTLLIYSKIKIAMKRSVCIIATFRVKESIQYNFDNTLLKRGNSQKDARVP